MDIKPKFLVGKKRQRFKPNKQFTNREYPRKLFTDKIKEILQRSPENEKQDVIMYYGVGGIGKSSLQRQLKKELLELTPALYTSIDLVDTSLHSPGRALLELVKEIKYEHKVNFPHFEIAYSIYFVKRNPDMLYNEKQLPYRSTMNIIGSVISVMDGFGVVGAATGIIDKIYATKKKWGLDPDIKELLKDLEKQSAKEVENYLPGIFAFDLQNAIEKYNIPVSVIFFDTYEAIWSDVKNEAARNQKDEWIRELVASLPNVLFVFCGREKLEWEQIHPAWKNILTQYYLGNLDEKDADLYLKQSGIEEADVRKKIIQASSGHPYHLDLSVDTYFEMKNRGEIIHPDQFGSNKREILDRFLLYLSDEEIETLKILSIPRFYNRDIFIHLLNAMPTGYPITKFDDFNKFSFITIEGKKHYIHNLMRESMLHYTSQTLALDIHNLMAEYYRGLLTKENNYTNENEILLFEEMIYHKKQTLSTEDYLSWLEIHWFNHLKKFQMRAESSFLKNLLGEIYDELGAQKISTKMFSILIDMVHLGGDYQTAIRMISEHLAGMSLEKITHSNEHLHLLIRKIHHQMFFEPVKPLIDQLLELVPHVPKDFKAQYNEILYMLGGNLGVLHGNYDFSRKWLVQSFRYSIKTNQPHCLCRTYRKYADVLRARGHLRWARICVEKGIAVTQANGLERYEANLLLTLGDIYRGEGKFEKAKETIEKAALMLKKQGNKAWGGHVEATYGEMEFQKGNYDAAVERFNQAYSIYEKLNQQWGMVISLLGLLKCQNHGVEIDRNIDIDTLKNKIITLNYLREEKQLQKILANESDLNWQLTYL